jgi:hypothetical protein
MSGVLNSALVVMREEALGNQVIFPAPNELLIDIDSHSDQLIYEQNLKLLRERYEVEVVETVPSKSYGHLHVTLRIKGRDLTTLERLLLQACLGSDRKRELLGFYNHEDGDERPTLFIRERKGLLNA